jgi:hypothetical protein
MAAGKKSTVTEWAVFAAFAASLAVITAFHEPWFDEAQAWLIARGATIRELLGSITHYEGHPPLWFLILMPFAKLGVPYEIGLKSINYGLTVAAAGLLIFKAPFPRLLRFTLPFTFFIFYQFGVISRPYSLLMLGFVLAAMAYAGRNQKPVRYAASLLLISASSAFGMVLAAGIAAVWLGEILRRPDGRRTLNRILDKRIFSLTVLLAVNAIQVFLIVPPDNAYAAELAQPAPFFTRLIYMLFMAPADAVCMDTFLGNTIDFSWSAVSIVSMLIGLFINSFFIVFAYRYKKTMLYILPFSLFALFGSSVYFAAHHAGILALFFLFAAWALRSDPPETKRTVALALKLIKTEKDRKMLDWLGCLILTIMMATSVYWTVISSFNEIKYLYGTGREAADFIKRHQLDQEVVLASWITTQDEKTGQTVNDYNFTQGTEILAYFRKNFIINYNGGDDRRCYVTHQVNSDDQAVKALAVRGAPGVLIGYVPLSQIFGDKLGLDDYALVQSVHGNKIWKSRIAETRQCILIRRDLLPRFPDLVELDISLERYFIIN